jgi:hypothetical protein
LITQTQLPYPHITTHHVELYYRWHGRSARGREEEEEKVQAHREFLHIRTRAALDGLELFQIIGAIIAVIVLAAVGTAVGVIVSKNNSNSSSSSSKSTKNGSSTATTSDPNNPSKFTKDPALHQAFYGMAYTPEGALMEFGCSNTLGECCLCA